LRRACASIPSNIAEGSGQNTPADMARFLHIAIGSSNEAESHLRVARNVRLLDDSAYGELRAQVVEVRKMLYGLLKQVLAVADTED
jgi:four helix bundle protein